jgi:integrase
VVEYADTPVRSIKKALARAARRAGLSWVSPHVLRHTAAVWMTEAGRPMAEIAQYLGHTDSRLTERVYARFSPDYLRGAAAALEV